VIQFLTALAIVAQVAVVSYMALRVVELVGGPRAPLDGLAAMIGRDAVKLAWLVALVATLGSLYMSEVRHFTPCVLCWYQRICTYPLVVVLGIAALRRDLASARWYAIPLAAIGACISAYHYQLERFPQQETIACSKDVPCTTIWFEQLGYVTIPMMALSAFALVIVILIAGGRRNGQGIANEA
jgi:disulfide bond formation protein DsbB